MNTSMHWSILLEGLFQKLTVPIAADEFPAKFYVAFEHCNLD